MDLRMSLETRVVIGFSLVLSIFSSPSLALAAKPFQRDQSAANKQLSSCLEIAKQGDVARAFEMAKQTKQTFANERMFEVSYINTLVSIVESQESKGDVKIINEAIKVVNSARASKVYDGTGDPEVAYHFMNALVRLGDAATKWSEPVAGKIRVFEGEIASNLRDNRGYPRNALAALANPMIDMAQAYAQRKEVQSAYEAIESAVSCGYGEYRELEQQQWFTQLNDKATRAQWMAKFDKTYAVAIQAWSQTVVQQFTGGSFNFSLDDLEGGRLSNADFVGKVTVVDLWATWCPPCRKGLPHYMQLQKTYQRQGVEVIGISMDDPEAPNDVLETVKSFVEMQKLNYPVAMGDTSIAGQLPGKMALPTTVFIDRNGRVRYIAQGYHDYAKVEAITRILVNESQVINAARGEYQQDF
jgi:thiol-disulfide isomerase/thioredoxin